jgi:hypothetical protein
VADQKEARRSGAGCVPVRVKEEGDETSGNLGRFMGIHGPDDSESDSKWLIYDVLCDIINYAKNCDGY